MSLLPLLVGAPATAHAVASSVPTGPSAASTARDDGAGASDARPGPRADRGLARGVDNWWFDAMGLAEIQRRTIGEGVQVAVIDSAIWLDAPDLAGVDLTVHRVCGPDPSVDDPRRGDHGAGMVANLAGQGTRGDGRPGLRGVAPGVAVHYYGHRDLVDSVRRNCISKQVVAAVDDGADIVSISQRWTGDKAPQQRALAYAADAGVVVVKSAGNAGVDRDMRDDGEKPGVVLVNQVDREGVPQGNVPPFMNRVGPAWNAVAAPGWEATGSGWVRGRGWVSGAEFNGTSNAAPIVAGQLALQKSVYPEATGNQLIQSLIHDTSNTDWEWLRGYGFGIAAISAMIERDPAGWPDVNPLVGTLPGQVLRRYPPEIYGTAEAAAAGTPSPTPAPAAATTSTPSAAPSTAAADAAQAPAASEAVPSGDDGTPPWVWPLTVAGVVVLLCIVALLARRRTTATSAGKD